jgi:hypothetical protein
LLASLAANTAIMISLAEMNTTPLVYASAIQGAGIFDLSGLPKEYFTTAESTDSDWVQTVFQELGLQALLLSVCQLEDFRYARIYGKRTSCDRCQASRKLHRAPARSRRF